VDAAVSRSKAVRRITFLVIVLLVWSAVIVQRLVSIQVFHHRQYVASARKQQEVKIDLPAIRGSIFDRNGQPLALSVSVDSVSINPLNIPNSSVAAELLAVNLNLDQSALYDKIEWCRKNKQGYLVVKHKLTFAESERLRSLPVNWIDFTTESQRHYPGGQIAAHVIGGVYKKEQGAAGIEKGMDAVLRGKGGMVRMLTDVKRRGIDSRVETPSQPGASLQLTIDERIQFVAEREIAAAVAKHHCRTGSVVVMNPYNGEILALANFPTYDPNTQPVPGDNPTARQDLGVSVPFEPGSIFKVMTLSAALETTNLKPTTMIATGNGALALPGRVVHDTRAHGTISMEEVLVESSNIGAIKIGMVVGREKMIEYVRRFGFGSPSGVPLPAESGGKLRKLEKWGTTSLASISMGQEISTTSIQLARACAVIANGGLLVKPKLILKRNDVSEPTEAPVRILRPETAITMRRMMEQVVVSEQGTGHRYCRLDGYTSGGKTGSAQIFDVKSHHYTHTYNASFMGFAPVTNPAVIVMVTLNGTVGVAGFGGPSAGPVFNTVATEALRILDVPKDLPDSPPPTKDDGLKIAANDLPISLDDNHSIMEEETQVASAWPEDAGAFIGPVVPDFRGKTVRQVVQESSESGLPVLVAGTGIAQTQTPLAGTPLTSSTKVRVQFRR
jgi:cell division protein FtsI (penicillin-binding protein 3)